LRTNERKLLRTIKSIILDCCGVELISLYSIGSFSSHEMIASSDIDLVGVMKPSFDFRREAEINGVLNRKIRSTHKIDLGTMSYAEFFGGRHQGSLMRHIELPIFLNFLKHAHLLYGKRIDFNKLPVKPASPERELSYHIKVFEKYKADFRARDRIGSDFSFRDFLKIIFYIANLELQLTRGQTAKVRYTEIDRALRTNKEHIVHYSMKLRRKRAIDRKERQAWVDAAERYVKKMRPIASGASLN